LAVKPNRYTSFPVHAMSRSHSLFSNTGDHKPISALFDVELEIIIPTRYQDINKSVLLELDRLENDSRPVVSISTDSLHFGVIPYLEPVVRSFTLINTGTVIPLPGNLPQGIARFHFHDMPPQPPKKQSDYIFIRPMSGSLGPSESLAIEVTILVGNKTIPAVANGQRPLDDILILEIANGRHIFLTLQGCFQRTCFGQPLEKLASYAGKGARNVEPDHQVRPGGGMPDEIWRMTDFIMKRINNSKSVFLERGIDSLCRKIRECLDTAQEFPAEMDGAKESEDEDNGEDVAVLSMAETLLRFLEALPEAAIPDSVLHKVMRIGESNGTIMEV
jgi:inositol polyphosphate 5-phosphatase INPP5B/F